MIFKSHLISMLIYTIIVAVMLAFIRFDSKKEIFRYGLKLFIYMTAGVIIFSWIMHFL
ncbi:MAG: hypothetical protein L0Y73_04950 [Candidatus Aminicenantes bacterium]|nr:hypothetical protein [Candidatus Aminicenantes bacterium]